MLKKQVFSILLILCIWLSTAGFTPLVSSSTQAAANDLVPQGSLMAAPGGFSKVSPEINATVYDARVRLTWGTSSGAVSYEYCVFTKNSCPPGQWKPAGTGNYILVPVKPGNSYWWQIRAVASDNSVTYANGSENALWKFTTAPAAPVAFTKSSPANYPTSPLQDINGVVVSWAQSLGFNVNYQVCYDTTNNNACDTGWQLAGTALSYPLNNLSYNTVYYWQVRAYNSKGIVYADGAETNYRNFKTKPAPPSSFGKQAPANLAVDQPDILNLVWGASPGLGLTYEYCIAADPVNNTCEQSNTGWISTGAETTAAPSLNYGLTYYWQVRVKSSYYPTADPVEANGGTWWRFSTFGSAPTTFKKIQPAHGTVDVLVTPYLYWSTSTGTGVTYEYCLKLASLGDCVEADYTGHNAGVNTFVHITTALTNNTAYRWQVRARDNKDNLVYANEGETLQQFDFTTLPVPPSWPKNGIQPVFTTPEDPANPYQGDLRLSTDNPGGRTLIYALEGGSPGGAIQLNSSGTFSFTPDLNFNGGVTFSFTIWDGVNAVSGPYTSKITVTAVNDPPVIVPFANISVPTGTDIYFSIDTDDPDLPYGDILTLTSNPPTGPTGSTYLITNDLVTGFAYGEFDWPAAAWTPAHPQAYSFTLTLKDKAQVTVQKTFTITIIANQIFLPAVKK